MKTITSDLIADAIADLCGKANFDQTDDIRDALKAGVECETRALAKNTLLRILENADIARERRMPMCQDTGLVVVFAEVGQDVHITVGDTLRNAIDAGVRRGYSEGYLRASVVDDPLLRRNTKDNTPAVVHTEIVPGDKLLLRLLAKGGGCENMSRFTMLTPADGRQGIIDFVNSKPLFLAGPRMRARRSWSGWGWAARSSTPRSSPRSRSCARWASEAHCRTSPSLKTR